MELPVLPVSGALEPLRRALATHTAAVLVAPPGAGKTTVVPLALLDEEWLGRRKIVVLEPRRLATRAAARRMANLLSERVGDTVGYRIRRDTRAGAHTRIEVVTEGILTRMLQSDPTLDDVGLVAFDEFHERSLHADLGLALALQSKRLFRDDLRLLVMSATLDAAPVATLLGGAPVIAAEGRLHPVETRYRDRALEGPIEAAVAAQVTATLRACARDGASGSPPECGDVLAFLPGAGEIHRTAAKLQDIGLAADVDLYPLFGNLPQREQDRAIAPSPPGRRKIVLATAIAQTSLTIEGVRVVIDSGRMRVPRFNPATGMTGLATLRVTADVAEQRRGRAGRTAPGVCFRLWTEGEQRGLVPQLRAQILDADLAPLMLELALWGTEPQQLAWLDPPPPGAMQHARELLHELDAVHADGSVTEEGRRMAALALHPRLARMLLRALPMHRGALAADIAALLTSRETGPRPGGKPDADVRQRLEALRRLRRDATPSTGTGAGRGGRQHVLDEARELRRAVGLAADARVRASEIEHAGELLALAYPDRVGRRRPGEGSRMAGGGASPGARLRRGVGYLLRNGRGAELAAGQHLGTHEWIVASDLVDRGNAAFIHQAAPLEREHIETLFAAHIDVIDEVTWNAAARRVDTRRQRRLGALVVSEGPLPDADPGSVRRALLEGIRAEGLRVLPWNKKTRQLIDRLQFTHALEPESWPDVSEEALLASLQDWLAPFIAGIHRIDDLAGLDLTEILWTHVGWQHRARLDELAPTHLEVPSGSRIPLDYTDPSAPALAVRLQEVFGLTETPRIGGGRVPVTMRLLSPAQRPVQVTTDLASFWRQAYFDVKKDLKGRYPKHHWPEDPLRARPTRRTRP